MFRSHMFIKSGYHNYDTILPITFETSITDHYTILAQIVLENSESVEKNRIRYYKHLNEKRFIDYIKKVNWDDIYHYDDLDSATNKLIKIIKTNLNKCTSFIKINDKQRKQKKWMTKSLVNSVNKKNCMYID